jgi:RimJ/RimL family protein N-acetyltransferase
MVDIVLLNESHLDEVRKLIIHTNFKPYRYLLKEIPAEKLDDYFYKQISETLIDKSSTPYVACSEGKVVGLGTLKDLAWDSDIFGIRMAKIEHLIADDSLTKTEIVKDRLVIFIGRQCANRGIEHLSCKVNTDDVASIHALERNRFRLMDTLLDYAFDFRKYPIEDFEPPCIIRPMQNGEDKDIAEIARVAFRNHFGRFHADKRLPRKGASELYAKWAENAYRGYADIVFVAELDKRIVGFSIWKNPGLAEELLGTKVGSYSLVGIHPDSYGRGIFKALTLAGMKWLKGKADIIEGPTHINNYPVQRGYATLMWQILDARHTFHKWIKRRVS